MSHAGTNRFCRWRIALICAAALAVGSPASAQFADISVELLAAEANKLSEQGKKKEAAVIARQVHTARRKLLGLDNLELRKTLRWCYDVHREAEEWDDARACLADIVTLYARNHGADHWIVKEYQVNVDDFDRERKLPPEQYREVRAARQEVFRAYAVAREGDLQEAAKITSNSIEVFERTIGLKYQSHVIALGNLAAFYLELGDLASALPVQQRAMKAAEELFGRQSQDYSSAISRLAGMYGQLRDWPRALALAKEDVELRRVMWGDQQPIYAAALWKLGTLSSEAGLVDDAIRQLTEAMEIQRRVTGEENREFASMLHSLAFAYSQKKEYRRSKELNERVLAISEKTIGKSHFQNLSTLNNLALANQGLGDLAEANKQLREVVAICTETYGAAHPERVAALRNLGSLHLMQGDYEAAEPLIAEVLALLRQRLDRSFGVLSERHQLLLTNDQQRTLYMLLTIAAKRETDVRALYDHVLAWKGAVYLHQRQSRIAHGSTKAREILGDLQIVASQIANLNSLPQSEKAKPEWREQLSRYLEAQEQIEAALARESGGFAALESEAKFTSADLQAILPADAVLIDFIQYQLSSPVANSPEGRWLAEDHLAAFVVKHSGEIELVQFGPVEPLGDLLQKWRREIVQRRGGIVAKPDDKLPQYALRRQLWQPLAEHATGCKTIFFSPDGVVAALPWAALPGDDAGKYLIEQYAVIGTPIPRHLVASDETAKQPASLCVVGGVDFGKSSKTPDEDAAKPPATGVAQRLGDVRFTALPGTAKEIDAIAKFFRTRFPKGRLAQGVADKATEDRVRQAAAHFNHLHFATHGFFVDETIAADDLAGDGGYVHPGLLSGIALAGANLRGTEGRTDDGILTALEVASLDLNHVELVVLSACETGLGTIVRGEGVLGLQRAFQLAGARTSLTSLWQVDDAATQTLMVEFYRGLWQESLGQAAALRQAQLAMLERYDPRASELKPRGLVLLGKTPEERAAARLAPYYWGAFVISGAAQ